MQNFQKASRKALMDEWKTSKVTSGRRGKESWGGAEVEGSLIPCSSEVQQAGPPGGVHSRWKADLHVDRVGVDFQGQQKGRLVRCFDPGMLFCGLVAY